MQEIDKYADEKEREREREREHAPSLCSIFISTRRIT